MNIGILFARKGSESIPGKNLMPLLGRPCFSYPLLALHHSHSIDQIFIATDDEKLTAKAKDYCNFIHLPRPDELKDAQAKLDDTIFDAFAQAKNHSSQEIQNITICMGNAPTILANTVSKSFEILDNSPETDSVITVSELPMFSPQRARKENKGYLIPYVDPQVFGNNMSPDRKDYTKCFFADGGLTTVRSSSLNLNGKGATPPFSWMGKNISYIQQEGGGGDIDDHWQIAATEYWLSHHGFTKDQTPYDK